MPQVRDSQVKKFWETRAQDQSLTDAEATHSDVWQRWLEIETIKPFLRPTDSMVDVGCGSGYATRLLAPCVREALGVDFSESMIERADRGCRQAEPAFRGRQRARSRPNGTGQVRRRALGALSYQSRELGSAAAGD